MLTCCPHSGQLKNHISALAMPGFWPGGNSKVIFVLVSFVASSRLAHECPSSPVSVGMRSSNSTLVLGWLQVNPDAVFPVSLQCPVGEEPFTTIPRGLMVYREG